jgi:transposase
VESRNAKDFTAWVRGRLAPRLQPSDIMLLDNLRAHKGPAVAALIARRGATVKFLPPYSYDLNPIEAVWALAKKPIRTLAPRTASRCVAPRAPLAMSWTPIAGSVLRPCRVRHIKSVKGLRCGFGSCKRLGLLHKKPLAQLCLGVRDRLICVTIARRTNKGVIWVTSRLPRG